MPTAVANITTDVYMVCLSHTLSTEQEEVMGLLIGEIDERKICHISAVIMLRRSDKRKDRVEISPEQLSDASTQAEELARVLCRPMRVLGWYHSHPHITVWPSQLDVQTQTSYQMMDDGFIGLIFSVFNEEGAKSYRIQVTCFQAKQSIDNTSIFVRQEIPLRIVPVSYISSPCLNALVELPKILCLEERSAYNATIRAQGLDILTKIHNNAVYSKALCHIAEVVSGPLLQALESRLTHNEQKKERLSQRRNELLHLLKELQECDNVCEQENPAVNTVTE